MASYSGSAAVVERGGRILEPVHAELWSIEGDGDTIWGGELVPVRAETFASGLAEMRGRELMLELGTGDSGSCRIAKARPSRPQLVRVEGTGRPPF